MVPGPTSPATSTCECTPPSPSLTTSFHHPRHQRGRRLTSAGAAQAEAHAACVTIAKRAQAIALKYIEDRGYLQEFGVLLRARDAERRQAAAFLQRRLEFAREGRDSARWLAVTGEQAVTMQVVHEELRDELGRLVEMARALRERERSHRRA